MTEEQGTSWFDMDGTIADLYGVDGWLDMLRAYDPTPYLKAKPLVNMSKLAKRLHKLQAMGRRIGIISWGSKVSTPQYDEAVRQAKEFWLSDHLPSVKWNEINIVPYGTPKINFIRSDKDTLYDDEARHRDIWIKGQAFTPEEIFTKA